MLKCAHRILYILLLLSALCSEIWELTSWLRAIITDVALNRSRWKLAASGKELALPSRGNLLRREGNKILGEGR